jgi:hypothetical protein
MTLTIPLPLVILILREIIAVDEKNLTTDSN